MIRKAVIPAAGFGTRFLPFTKSMPKEMLPIVDTPVIQYVVEEAVAAGVTDILMIIGRGKRAIEEHFDRSFELEEELEAKGKTEELATLRRISEMANVHFVWQKELRGLGDAVIHARHHVNNEPFVLLLGDTLIQSTVPVVPRLVALYEHYNETVVALEQVEACKIERYGIVGGRALGDGVFMIDRLVEKPSASEAPSNLAIASRYVLSPLIFDYLDRTPPGKNGEVQLTDAMQAMIAHLPMYGYAFGGKRHDIGSKLDFLKTNVLYGLEHGQLGPEFRKFIEDIARGLGEAK
jgi:UTP--glucose-1-phosphate uridylyltransferase